MTRFYTSSISWMAMPAVAAAINDDGVMVGGSLIDSGGIVQDRNSLFSAKSGYQLTDVTAINADSQIVATASDAATSQAAVVLNPG